MIRPATTADLPRLRSIQRASLEEPWEELLEPAIAGPQVALVVTDGADDPCGYAVAIPDATDAYLAEIAVAPGVRGEGRGSRLLAALCDRLAADGVATLRLTVRVDDERARRFYADHGFDAERRLPDHYEDGDGLVLVRPLQN